MTPRNDRWTYVLTALMATLLMLLIAQAAVSLVHEVRGDADRAACAPAA